MCFHKSLVLVLTYAGWFFVCWLNYIHVGYLCTVLLMLGAKMSPEKRIRGSFSAWLFSAVANLRKDFGLFSADNLIKVLFVKWYVWNRIFWGYKFLSKLSLDWKSKIILITINTVITTIPIIITISTTKNDTPSSSLSQAYLPPLMLDNMLDFSVSKRSTSFQICKNNKL